MNHRQTRRDDTTRSNHPNSRKPANQADLKGISRLVNPRSDDPEIAEREDEAGDRDYVGRWLHVADQALHQVKNGERRKPRRVH